MGKSTFQTLNEYDITPYIKEKNKLSYLPWSSAWTIIKTIFPDASYSIIKDEDGNIYHTDGKTCWVETSLTINGETQHETLAVMDYRNKSIKYEDIASTDAGNSIKRCLVKNAALFGLGLSLWIGEELSDAAKKAKDEKEAQEKARLKKLSEANVKIIDLAKEKIAQGVSADVVYQIIADHTGGKKNPNAIKDIETSRKIYDEINALEVVKENAE